MDTLEQATINFEKTGFHLCEHISYKPPINNPKEIEILEEKLSKAKGPPHQAILEMLLEEQEKGQEESITYIKTFKEFQSIGENQPFINGLFYVTNSTYELKFFARDLETENHPLSQAGTKTLDFDYQTDRKLREILNQTMDETISNMGLPEVKINLIKFQIQLKPTFSISSKPTTDFEHAYSNLKTAMQTLGYNLSEL